MTWDDGSGEWCVEVRGPGANLASGGSLVFHSEGQMRFIERGLQILVRGARALEPTEEATRDWFERTKDELDTLVWTRAPDPAEYTATS